MCVKQRTISTTMSAATVTTTTTVAPPPQRAAAGETTASIVSNRDPPQGGIVIKAGSSPSSPHSATLLSLPRVNLAPLLATNTSAAAAAGMPTAELDTQLRREHRENYAIFVDNNNSGKEAEAFAAGGALALALVNESEDDQRDKTARAQDFEDASDRIEYDFDDDNEDSMGQCYPKCMNQYEDGGVILPGMRAKRSSKQRTNLSSMKNPAVTLDYGDDGGDDDCGDFEAIGHTMGALDLEELASGNIVNALFDQPPKSIVVDYEEAHDVDQQQHRPRQNSVTDCARDACRPMDHAQNQVEELIFANDPKSTPLTPGRRRSRKDSIGNSNSNSNTSAATPRRGKSVILENTKVVAREPVSPLTDTDVSEADSDLRCSSVPKLCLCEVKLHKTKESCWLVANNEVFDVTGILDVHPGGSRSILRKAGGPDCTQDMKFHTKNARKMLDKCFIGKLQPCGDEPERQDSNCSIM